MRWQGDQKGSCNAIGPLLGSWGNTFDAEGWIKISNTRFRRILTVAIGGASFADRAITASFPSLPNVITSGGTSTVWPDFEQLPSGVDKPPEAAALRHPQLKDTSVTRAVISHSHAPSISPAKPGPARPCVSCRAIPRGPVVSAPVMRVSFPSSTYRVSR